MPEKIIARAIVLFDGIEDYSEIRDQIFLIETEDGFKIRDFAGYLKIFVRKRCERHDIVQEICHKDSLGKMKKSEENRIIEKGVINNEETKRRCLAYLLEHKVVKHLSEHFHFTYIRAHSCICLKGEIIVK